MTTQKLKCPCCGNEIEMMLEAEVIGSSTDCVPVIYEDMISNGGGGQSLWRVSNSPYVIVKDRADWPEYK